MHRRLTDAQMRVLEALPEKGTLSRKELLAASNTHKAGYAVIEVMITRGFVIRTHGPKGAVMFGLTEAGRIERRVLADLRRSA
jgi:DNA-binding MarR family transcriptional regulator